jgi:hypothetical protein
LSLIETQKRTSDSILNQAKNSESRIRELEEKAHILERENEFLRRDKLT